MVQSRVAGLLGTKKRIELERRKQEIEREKDELKQFYSEAFECSTHSVNHDPNFLQLLDDVVVSIKYWVSKTQKGGDHVTLYAIDFMSKNSKHSISLRKSIMCFFSS